MTSQSTLQTLNALRTAIDDHLERLMRTECDDSDAADAIAEAMDYAEKARAAACTAICACHGLKPGDRVKGCGPNVPQDTCGAPIGTVQAISEENGTAQVQWDGRDSIWHNADDLKRL